MSTDNNPRIISSNLVFHYDTSSTRSYTGPAIRNIASSIYQNYGDQSNSTFKISNGTEVVNIPTLGKVTSKYVDVYNDYNGGSGQCCPSLYSFGSDLATNASTLHTYAIVYKSMNEYTNGNYMYRYEYNGATYVLEAGVFDTAKRIHLGDGWYWAWNTFTTNAATTRFNYIAFFMYEYLKYNRISVAKVLLTQGDYTTLHPRFWPEVNTTRSATQVLRDMTSTSTLTANSLAYAANGDISFNGSNSFISIPNSSALQVGATFTINAWINASSLSARHGVFSTRTANDAGSWQLEVGTANSGAGRIALTGVGTWIWESSSNVITTNTWYNICVVKTNNAEQGASVYLNGVLLTPGATTAYTILDNSNIKAIGQGTAGSQFFSGSIRSTSLYNRALTAGEVLQNFNAHKGRYGL
jgi:hypothetical protein